MMAQKAMTTKELDEIFCKLQGVEQFVVGNIALDRYRHFFLNLDEAQKLDCLNARGHALPRIKDSVSLVKRNGKRIPPIIDLLIDVRRCRSWGFVPGHPIREALRGMIKRELPVLKARIAENKRARVERNRKPEQLRLF